MKAPAGSNGSQNPRVQSLQKQIIQKVGTVCQKAAMFEFSFSLGLTCCRGPSCRHGKVVLFSLVLKCITSKSGRAQVLTVHDPVWGLFHVS